ncbi:BZ3500_MvSof-1268-A1-R1_Chr5-3g08143 [Microbotryum saponariae]|uniref:BZ3500_MvSof-1268-A1-R1_Chr5-3g08143 protein n=1 Tax=Microbotryum saponariae TaxID=289078 RepID=A0A2X0NIU6_9BASI|nr:BZ3500_MvSof-1268-A1-R1_Chr5-3g08143 [Microbotryum saponariae]SDA07902.1 BZ3501_MvSof-1269-A2-R1_Chr5-1g07287 [Microbotryum saponariae]
MIKPRLAPRLLPSTQAWLSSSSLSASSSSSSSHVRAVQHPPRQLQRRWLATGPTAPTPARRSTYDIALLVAGGAGISGLLIWSASQRKEKEEAMGRQGEGMRSSFTVPVISQTGAPGTKTLTRLSPAETDARLKEHEASYAVSRRANPVFRYDTTSVASNSPIEDDSCCVILERDGRIKDSVQGDLVFWGVFDGHSGWQTSRLLSSTLVSYVARELDLVFRGAPVYAAELAKLPSTTLPTPPSASASSSSGSSIWSLFSSAPPQPKLDLDVYDPILQTAIKNAFAAMDNQIVQAPVRLLEKAEKAGNKLSKPSPEQILGLEESEALQTLLPALSGSCALLCFLDAGRNKLHVACTGDSRAVMGTWEPAQSGGGGKWRAEVLSDDQTGRNPKEVKRMQSEHPPEEAETVITRGRVLGGLEPTRAFGDARYKWPPGTAERLAQAFHPGSVRGRPKNYHTPPYVTAVPEVVSVDLSAGLPSQRRSLASFLPVSSSSEPPQPQATRFIVLATDGLYDRLNNDEIVALVGGHLSGVRGNQSRPSVMNHVNDQSIGTDLSHMHAPRQEPTRGEGDVFSFEDGNLATHLVRNALGGAKKEQVSVLLSIPAPLSRRYRDDITVTVILLADPVQGGEGGAGGVYRRDTLEGPIKAKL